MCGAPPAGARGPHPDELESRLVAEPGREQAKRDGQQNVAAGVKPLALAQQGEGLQAEGRKRGEAAAKADHHELAVLADPAAPVSFRRKVYRLLFEAPDSPPAEKVIDRIIGMSRELVMGNAVIERVGDVGSLPAELATPLAMALAKSLNTVAIQLSIAIGNGNAKEGRAKNRRVEFTSR